MIASTSKAKAAVILVAVFAAGGLSGAAVMELAHGDPPPVEQERRDGRDGREGSRGRYGQSERFLGFLNTRLELSEEQQASIRSILVRNEKDARELWNGIRADLEAGVERTRAEIREVLTPEQVEKFDAILTEERGRRRGSGPPGPSGMRPPPGGPGGGPPIDDGGAASGEETRPGVTPRPLDRDLHGDSRDPHDVRNGEPADEHRGRPLGPIERV